MSPEFTGFLVVAAALAGVMITFLIRTELRIRRDKRLDRDNQRLDQTNGRIGRNSEQSIGRNNERIDTLIDEVRAIAQSQARTDRQLQALIQSQARTDEQLKILIQAQTHTDAQVKGVSEQLKESVAELQTVGRNQARLEGEVMIIKDAFLLRAVGNPQP